MILDLTHQKPERADVMAVTLAGNHPSSLSPVCLWSRTGVGRRSSETRRKVQSPRGMLRASSERAPPLVCHNWSLSPDPGTASDSGLLDIHKERNTRTLFIILRRKKKKKRNPHVFESSGRRCFNLVPWPLLAGHTPGQPPSSAAQQLQGLKAPRDTLERVSSGQ